MNAQVGGGLDRFLAAQGPVITAACAELAKGRKESHWMWFVFPQLQGLGQSPAARFYGIADQDEAAAYWRHGVLRERLLRCARLVLSTKGRTAYDIFGSPDDAKLRSCMTLFAFVVPEEPAFNEVLTRFFGGVSDPVTVSMLQTDR